MFAAAYERTIEYSDISALRDGDYFKDGKLFDAEGNEGPMRVVAGDRVVGQTGSATADIGTGGGG